MPKEKDLLLLPRVLVVMTGFLLIVLDQFFLTPWLRFTGGFLAVYAFAPGRVNPLLEYLNEKLNKEKKATG